MSLKPRHILLVIPPTPLLQLPRREVLLIRPLCIVEYKKETIRPQFLKHPRIFKDEGWRRGVGGWCWVGVAWCVRPLTFGIDIGGAVEVGFIECSEVGCSGIVGGGGGGCTNGGHGVHVSTGWLVVWGLWWWWLLVSLGLLG